MRISRRSLTKGLVAAAAAPGLADGMFGENTPAAAELSPAGWNQIHPGVWKATVGIPERYTPVSSRLIPVKTDAFAKLPAVDILPLPEIRGKRTQRGCLLQLPLWPDEQIYGMGLQLLSFAQRGTKKVVRVNADPKVDTGDSHAPVPFYVTTNGIGVLIDTARYASFYFGDARPKPEHAVDSASSANPDPNYTHSIQDSVAGQITVEIPRVAGVDVYLFGGPKMLDAVRRYNIFSGGGVAPPEWGLGFWYRMDARATQQSALALAGEFRDRKIPCDVIGLEPGWQTHAYSCTFAWNRDSFPDPDGFVHSAREMNFRINLWEHAFTHPASPLFSQIESNSGDYGVWGGLVPDFAGEPARAAFAGYHAKTFLAPGVSGFKLDECDNSDFTGGWSFPECSAFPSGVDGEQMHNVFGLRYQMAIWNAFRSLGESTYGLVRSSGALAAPYPFVLYSDLYDHRQYVRALVNSGFSGLLWCPEVRQASSVEDLIRRLQSAVFSPLAQVDCWYMKNPPWKQIDRARNNTGELIDDWEKLEARCREVIGWRMQLVPYLQAAFQHYEEIGTPPFRAPVLDSPNDKRLYSVDDQYMIGDRMMIAPLFAGEPSRKVVLPQGSWHDFWSGAPMSGGSEINIPASNDRIPIYVKTGSIIPWADVGQCAGASETRRITARVYGDGSIPFALDADKTRLRLSWSHGKGSEEGTIGYVVHTWQEFR